MSKHKHVNTAAHENQAPEASPPEAPAAEIVNHAAVAAPAPVVAPTAAAAPPVDAAPAAAATPAATAARVASSLYDVGVTWAQMGIGLGKTALESLARALDRTAKLLGDLQTQIKVNAEKPAA
jgi:predicted amidohydrolase YtcJ